MLHGAGRLRKLTGQERSLPGASGRNPPCLHHDFSQGTRVWLLSCRTLGDTQLVLF